MKTINVTKLVIDIFIVVFSVLFIHSIYMGITRNDIVIFVFTVAFFVITLLYIFIRKIFVDED